MTLQLLATHVAELAQWITLALTTDEHDFGNNDYKPETVNNNTELLNYFERALDPRKKHLTQVADEQLTKPRTILLINQPVRFLLPRNDRTRP